MSIVNAKLYHIIKQEAKGLVELKTGLNTHSWLVFKSGMKRA